MVRVAIVAREASHCFATWDRVFFAVWRLAATPQAVGQMMSLLRSVMATQHEPCTFLGIVEPTSPPPDEKSRAQLARFSKEIVPALAVAIMVGEGGGFRTSLVRAVGVTLTSLMPHRVPFRFLGSVESAIPVMAPYLSPAAGGADGLRRAHAEVRAAFPPSNASP